MFCGGWPPANVKSIEIVAHCVSISRRCSARHDGSNRAFRSAVLLLSNRRNIPQDHLLRLVDKQVDFAFVRETLKASYSHTGRPSIDPEVLLRILLIGYLYGITSERRLVEDVGMHLAYRWFTGLGFEQEILHHSTFSKNRHGRFQESPLFLELFEWIVQQCMDVGLLKGDNLSLDSTQIRADASPDRAITREQLSEVAKVNRTMREYVEQVERENVITKPA